LEAAAAAVAAAGSDNAHFRPEEEFTAHKITLGVKDAFVAQVTEVGENEPRILFGARGPKCFSQVMNPLSSNTKSYSLT
jgi:hypothetical protein